MAGKQVKFELGLSDFNVKVNLLYKIFIENLKLFRIKYLGVDILHIQLMFITVRSFLIWNLVI